MNLKLTLVWNSEFPNNLSMSKANDDLGISLLVFSLKQLLKESFLFYLVI